MDLLESNHWPASCLRIPSFSYKAPYPDSTLHQCRVYQHIRHMSALARAPFHVLGAGSIGLLYAYHLRRAGNPVILMVRDWRAADRFQAAAQGTQVKRFEDRHKPREQELPYTGGCIITLEHNTRGRHEMLGVDAQAEAIIPTAAHNAAGVRQQQRHAAPISNLLVATKAGDVVRAVRSVQHRLTQDSALILLQNGVLAVYQELYRDLLSQLDYPPKVVIASTTHGCYLQKPFHVFHAGVGTCSFAEVDSTLADLSDPAHQYLWQMPRSPVLQALLELQELGACSTESHAALLHQLHLKLAVNCVINPITALLQCMNGHVVQDMQTKQIMQAVCQELHSLFATHMPTTTQQQLYDAVFDVAQSTARNKSSMYQDIQHGRVTEIDYLNGFVVRQGIEKQVPTPVNNTLYQLLKAKERLASNQSNNQHAPRSSL